MIFPDCFGGLFFNSNGSLIKQSNGLEFLYDHTSVFAVKHNNTTYFYRKDAQANIVDLLDNSGVVVVKYKYDAWGKCQTTVINPNASTIAELNPLRYRSYYFDTETGFYFLKTRYYDPEIGRFMTIDDISYLDPESINGLNLYAYCGDNPVIGYDPNGTWDWGTFWRVLGSTLAIAGGIALCFVPGLQAIGAGLIITGAGGMIGGTVSLTNGYGFNYGWDIGTIIGGAIGLVVAAPQLLGITFNASIPFLAPMLTTVGELVLAGVTVSVAIPVGGAIAVTAGVGLLMFAKASTGPIRFSDGTGINPETGKPVIDKEEAYRIYKQLQDKTKKANWKKWMKGKGWRTNHLK